MNFSEDKIIALIRDIFAANLADGARDLVDDCAWMPACPTGFTRVISCDAFQEGNDFLIKMSPAFYAGHKAIMQNLSDLAAAGAKPGGFVWSLEIPAQWLKEDARLLKEFVIGAAQACESAGLKFFGGDLSHSLDRFSCAITVWGDCDKTPLSRKGAKAGDIICVSGPLGQSARGLLLLRQYSEGQDLGDKNRFDEFVLSLDQTSQQAIWQQVKPTAHHQIARQLTGIASACTDVSDGLSRDLHHICRASNVGAILDRPFSKEELFGGEDFVLLYTVDPNSIGEAESRIGKNHVIQIGMITSDTGQTPPTPEKGFDHFASLPDGHTSL